MKKESVFITTEFIRLDALLKLSSVAETGGQAKMIIQNGEVLLNGEVCTQRGKKVFVGDTVTVDSIEIEVTKP